jgi:hypothetical protein
MKHLVFLLEEPSAKEMLNGLLPRLLPGVSYRCIVFEGKQDLEKNLVKKIRAYRVPNSQFIVLLDQDAGDCYLIKQKLVELCEKANKTDSLVRIVCRELESWYLADLKAVELGLKISGLAKHQSSQKYRSPDYLQSPSKELKPLTKDKYQKVVGSRKLIQNLKRSISQQRMKQLSLKETKKIGYLKP